MIGSFATRIFRIVFAAAGCYNLAFGIWAGFFPLQFFQLFGIAPPLYPQIWSCLGMVVGLYGLLYWHAAWKLETAWPIIAVGLLGKILGPIGMAMNVGPLWPARIAILLVYNDFLWWLPFGLFLIRGTGPARKMATWPPLVCAATHAIAALGILLLLRGGIATQPDVTQRVIYIAKHPAAWSIGWIAWMVAALSLVLFYAWWGSRVNHPALAAIAVCITAIGIVFDLAGDSLSALILAKHSQSVLSDTANFDPVAFATQQQYTVWLSAGVANFLYIVSGVLLTVSTKTLPRWVVVAMWLTWASGIWMSIAAFSGSVVGLVASTAILFPVFIAWLIWMGWRWRPQ
jgi:hypothetical protein